jgi:uncharacterized protein (DUF1786 family)
LWDRDWRNKVNGFYEQLEDFDKFVVQWFNKCVNSFTVESGLLPVAVQDLGFSGEILQEFLYRISMLHSKEIEIATKRAKQEQEKGRKR